MLETAVADSADKLGLEKEIAETSRVDADVGTLLVDVASRSGGGLSLLAVGSGGGLVGTDLLVGVVNEVLLGGHDGDGG